jgi:hypothetical protein
MGMPDWATKKQEKPGYASAGASGVRTGVEGVAGMGGDLPIAAKSAGGWLGRRISGATPEQTAKAERLFPGPGERLLKALQSAGIVDQDTVDALLSAHLPTSTDVASVTDPVISAVSPEAQKFTRADPKDMSFGQRALFETGAFLPALATGGAEIKAAGTVPGMISEAIKLFGKRVAAPAVASETAGTVAHEYAPEYEPLIRLVTAAATGGLSPTMENAARLRDAARQIKTNPAALARVTAEFVQSGMTQKQALQKIDDLGGSASPTMPVDINPNLLQEGQRIVARGGGPGRTTITERTLERQEATPARVKTDVEATLGTAMSPTEFETGIKRVKGALSPEYERALQGPGVRAVDTTTVSNDIESAIANERGAAQSALKQVRDMLRIPGTEHLDPSPRAALSTRHAIDGMIDATEDGNVRRVLTQARQALDQQLGVAVPGIKDVDAKFAKVAEKATAFEEGQKSLQKGSKWPKDIKADIAQKGAPVLEGLREGVRTQIEDIIGNTGYNATGLKNAIKGDGTFNREKLEILFGKEKADRIGQVLKREQTYQRSHVRLTEQSPTAERAPGLSEQDRLDLFKDVPVASAIYGPKGAGLAVLKNIGQAALDKFRQQAAIARDAEVANLLTSNEPTRVLRGIQLAQQRGAVLPQTMVSALLSRQYNKGQ